MRASPFSPSVAAPAAAKPVYAARAILALLVASVCYLAVLSFCNARGLQTSAALVGAVEALLYGVCLLLQLRRLPLTTVTLGFCIFSWVIFTWLVRQSMDLKSLRDLLIPLLFVSLGRQVADARFANRCVTWITTILVALGLFETLFTTAYSQLFNTFSFYVNLGGIRESSAMFEGQMLTLNGYRPEGIGRTIFPMLLGAHRTSSALMEPVSLGNFAVILLAWGLSRPWAQIRKAPGVILCAGLLIALSDSRLGLVVGMVLLACRALPLPIMRRLAPLVPFLVLAGVIAVALSVSSIGDNVLGRVSRSGTELLHFDAPMVFGLNGPLHNFGDMGFAYILSRFGAVLCLVLLLVLFTVPMVDMRGEWFRVLIVLYMFANFAISGTSVFALKTAGLMWFLFGVLSTARREVPRPLQARWPEVPAPDTVPGPPGAVPV